MKNYLKTGTLLLGISLLLNNCQKEELISEPLNEKSNPEYELISKTKDWYEQNKHNLIILNYTKTINWGEAIVSNGLNGLIVEVPLILNDNIGTQFSLDKSLISYHRLLFLKDKSGINQIYHVQITSNVKNFDNNNKKFNNYSLNSTFNGYISILNSDNQITEINKFKNGKKPSNAKQGVASREGIICVYIGWWYDDGHFEPISLLYCTDGGGGSDSYYGGGGGSGGNTTPVICDPGYIKDANGNCVKKPCSGNPVENPEITSSGGSGKKGGTFGCTRSHPNRICNEIQGQKLHDGMDISAAPNSKIYAMYSGTVIEIRNTFASGQQKKDSYGNYVKIKSVIDGQTVTLKFNHLNTVSVIKGQTINAGDIMGLSGTTGNAGGKGIIPHVHIQAYNSNLTSINPQNFLTTKFDSNYNPININNCN